MAKASFATQDAYTPALGFQEGWARVTAASIVVFQFPADKKTGTQNPPALYQKLVFQKTDEKGKDLEDEPQDRLVRVTGDLEHQRPGQAASRDDADPEDLGDELDTEGNVIYVEEGVKINSKSALMVWNRSLEEKGFKVAILQAGYSPDLIGLAGYFKTVKQAKISFGDRDVEPNCLVADKITVYPYESAKKKPIAAATSTAAVKGKVNGAAKPVAKPAVVEEEEAGDAGSGGDAEDVATRILTELAAELTGETRDAKKLQAMAYSRLARDKSRDRKLDKAVQELIKSDDFLADKALELGYTYDEGVFSFEASEAA